MSSLVRVGLVGLICSCLPWLAGCGSSEPKLATYPVTGTVKYANGSPVKFGVVEFRSEGEDATVATGEIQPDGRFALSTVVENVKLEGTVAGSHRVSITPLDRDNHASAAVELHESFQVLPTGSNDFNLTVTASAGK